MVDANNTPWGPSNGMSEWDGVEVLRALALDFVQTFGQGLVADHGEGQDAARGVSGYADLRHHRMEEADALRQRVEAHEALMIDHDALRMKLDQAGARIETLTEERDVAQRELDLLRGTRTWRLWERLTKSDGRRR